ncbi:MAG: hypothetical protein ABI862_20585 [Ilumatobacteraceae bacterium]
MSGDLSNRLWGCGDIDRLFGTADRTVTPWPRGGKLKYGENFDRNAVTALLASPVGLIDIDPREVWCSQPWLLREHVDYYRTGRWELSGRTSADQFAEHNRFPIIVRDYHDRLLVVAGHHRTAAALIEGRQVRARVAILGSSFHVTPLLTVDQTPAGAEVQLEAERLLRGLAAIAPTLCDAVDVLKRAGVPVDETFVAVDMARRRLPG